MFKVTSLPRFLLLLIGVICFTFISVVEANETTQSAETSSVEKLIFENNKSLKTRSDPITADDAPQVVIDAIAQISQEVTHIGKKEEDPPVWPLFWKEEVIGWAFDSSDLIQIPGFAGSPIEVLIVLDKKGDFTGLKVLEHNEPVFQHGVGPGRLNSFGDQYADLSVRQNIKVRIRKTDGEKGGSNKFIDGVTMATASVVVMNDTILQSALKVASQKLEGFSFKEPAQVRYDQFEQKTWEELIQLGWVQNKHITYQEINSLFADTDVAEINDEEGIKPDDLFIDLYFGYLNAPTIGRNLLGDEEFDRLINKELEPGENALLVAAKGPYSFKGDNYIDGSVPDRLALFQGELPVELRDTQFYRLSSRDTPLLPEFDEFMIFTVKKGSIFDPASPWNLNVVVQRTKGFLYEKYTRSLPVYYQLPESLFTLAKPPEPRKALWVQIWESRTTDVVILIGSLIILSIIFIFQNKLVESTNRLRWIRWLFLTYTLFFIGWYAQGQLSVVNIYPIIASFKTGFDINTYLLDPITFILWIYVFISLFLWGRGLFCGWLCPFGALQEMLSWVAKKLKIKQWKISDKRHQQLWSIKYLLLIGLVGLSLFSTKQAVSFSEIEPFKTAITEKFVRHWPFVLYAVVILGLGLFVHKFYCRYVCPLGAGLAILGRFHRFKWLSRREECGTPCTYCSSKKVCEIRAIEPSGEINYKECIQCLDCVAVLKSDERCSIRVLEIKKLKVS